MTSHRILLLAGALGLSLTVPAPASVSALLPDLNSTDLNTRTEAQKALFREASQAARPGAEAERRAYGEALCRALAEEPPPLTAHVLIQQLERIGGAESCTLT